MEIHFEEPSPLVLIVEPRIERLTLPVAACLRALVAPRLAGKILVIVDIGPILEIDGGGLGCLVGLLKAAPRGSQLRLARPSRSVRSLLALTRLDRVFSCHGTVASALLAHELAA